jgi:peroxiredoxin
VRAPEVSFQTPDGGDVTTSQLVAGSNGLPVLLVFFKTSCPTCKLSWPYLQKLHAAYGGKSVRVVGVAQDPAEAARAFSAEFGGATFELVVDAPPYPASNAFHVESVPHLSLLSPVGALENLYEGWSKDSIEALGARLAAMKGLAPAELVAPGDPVAPFKPG